MIYFGKTLEQMIGKEYEVLISKDDKIIAEFIDGMLVHSYKNTQGMGIEVETKTPEPSSRLHSGEGTKTVPSSRSKETKS